ncbi:MAG: DNA sulfur modification protein DndB [Cycloclasticus sp.]|nr:DNA sulfur modification protein DndB [Cycloclasticus sp.]MBQ0790655.1 DNA sulfur modification protein DndB [Cycloclasticus sp.]
MNTIISGTSFPAIRGIQAGNEYYIVMCPLKRLRKIFTFDESALPVEQRAQRCINPERIPEITDYILADRENYVFSAITACIDGESQFTSIGDGNHQQKIGTLIIDEDAELYITDGQHRNAAILEALKQDPSLANETISVVFFANKTLENRQKIFKDLNLYPVKTDSSLSITYDDKPDAMLSKTVIFNSPILSKLTHMERSNLGKRSKKLISHSAFNIATKKLFDTINESNYQALVPKATEFWECVSKNMPAWILVYKDEISASDIRDEGIHAYSVTFQAIGIVGNWLLKNDKQWEKTLIKLKDIDWQRSNRKDWEGRCVSNGEMRNSSVTAKLTANKIKQHLGIPLNEKEQCDESKLEEARNGL